MSRNLERSEWQEYICDDLQPVVRWLDEQHNIHITEIVFDMKGIYTYIYVDSPLTKELVEEAGKSSQQMRGYGSRRDGSVAREILAQSKHRSEMIKIR